MVACVTPQEWEGGGGEREILFVARREVTDKKEESGTLSEKNQINGP